MKEIDFSHIYQKIIEAYKIKRRFILYRKPYDNLIYLCIDSDNHKEFISNFYLLIGDFQQKNIIIIHPNEIFFSKIKNTIHQILNNHINHFNHYQDDSLVEYYNIIKKALILINKQVLNKVVISRKQEINVTNIDLKTTIQNLLNTYFESLINIWYDPQYGLWIGATPELLFYINHSELLSIALAGTRLINDHKYYPWNFKELKEHYIVVNYIVNILNRYFGKLYLESTQILKTGFIKHLKTLIKFSFFKEPPIYQELLALLHPTPAVCGIPKDIAYNFIINHENYNRSFYTGYIGIINNNISEFYVNLRCANILDKLIVSYAGCGITNYSNPKDELLESKLKMQNILANINFN